MTLLGWWAFDAAATLKYPEWDAVFNSADTGRDGVAAHATTTGNNTRTLTPPGVSSMATVIFGCALNCASSVHGSTTLRLVTFQISGSDVATLNLDATGKITLRSGGTTGTILATGTNAAFGDLTWKSFQVKFVAHTSSGTCIVKVDGTTVLSVTGAQTASSSGAVTTLLHRGVGSTVVIDDGWLCDGVDATATQGAPNNDFMGDLRVAHLLPDGDGASSGWTRSTGSTNYTLVDDASNALNTTDYVSAVAASSADDLYTLADLPSLAGQVLGVRVGVYGAKTDAGAAAVKTLVRENSTTTADSAGLNLSTTYGGLFGTFRTNRPSDGAAFTVSDVNAMQAGQRAA